MTYAAPLAPRFMLSVALARATKSIFEQVMGLVDEGPSQKARALCERASSTAEDPGAPARSIAQDAGHRQFGVVVVNAG